MCCPLFGAFKHKRYSLPSLHRCQVSLSQVCLSYEVLSQHSTMATLVTEEGGGCREVAVNETSWMVLKMGTSC